MRSPRRAAKAPRSRAWPYLQVAAPQAPGAARSARSSCPAMLRDPQRPFAPPADATEVLLARHGSAGAADDGRRAALVGGHTDLPLAPIGHAQARALASRLPHPHPAAVFLTPP